jgi:hypothetical protein
VTGDQSLQLAYLQAIDRVVLIGVHVPDKPGMAVATRPVDADQITATDIADVDCICGVGAGHLGRVEFRSENEDPTLSYAASCAEFHPAGPCGTRQRGRAGGGRSEWVVGFLGTLCVLCYAVVLDEVSTGTHSSATI